MEKQTYPMRINKYLALRYKSTRRDTDELIKNKQVYVNGKLAVLGAKINKDDVVDVWQDETKSKKYVPYAKPKGIRPTIYKKDKIAEKAKKRPFSF